MAGDILVVKCNMDKPCWSISTVPDPDDKVNEYNSDENDNINL
jgi:hypothetical protein